MLTEAAVPFTPQARIENKNKVDFILPSEAAYHQPTFPADALVFLAAKTTVRARWRQILPEPERIPEKHLLTLQQGLSEDQLHQIASATSRWSRPSVTMRKIRLRATFGPSPGSSNGYRSVAIASGSCYTSS